jgi:hypothetical protein
MIIAKRIKLKTMIFFTKTPLALRIYYTKGLGGRTFLAQTVLAQAAYSKVKRLLSKRFGCGTRKKVLPPKPYKSTLP